MHKRSLVKMVNAKMAGKKIQYQQKCDGKPTKIARLTQKTRF